MINPCFMVFAVLDFVKQKAISLCQNADEIVFDLYGLIESMELELLSFLSFYKESKVIETWSILSSY